MESPMDWFKSIEWVKWVMEMSLVIGMISFFISIWVGFIAVAAYGAKKAYKWIDWHLYKLKKKL